MWIKWLKKWQKKAKKSKRKYSVSPSLHKSEIKNSNSRKLEEINELIANIDHLTPEQLENLIKLIEVHGYSNYRLHLPPVHEASKSNELHCPNPFTIGIGGIVSLIDQLINKKNR